MAAHKHIGRVCAVVLALTLALTLLFMGGEALGIETSPRTMGYEARLFDTGRVHTIDIVMDDWEGFLETCENEEYVLCSLVIDGEAVKSAGIRAKGNTSLTSVASYGNDRYSFKVEFDHYDSSGSYYGLDKLSLNNIIQDNTYMKDFLVYQMMGDFGVAAPLCSYAFLTVNGEPWGLYLAAEGVEDGFLERNYGGDSCELYKPDSSSFGGGRGNGGGFNMEDLMENFDPSAAPEDGQIPPDLSNAPEERSGFGEQGRPGGQGAPGRQDAQQRGGDAPGGMGSSDVKLQYIDDDPESYVNIFDNAKTDPTPADKARLIAALQTLSEEEDAGSAVDVERVIRYFVVHGFVCNGDSYTGSIVHNYYLYEEDGKLSMIPWDYNLAFGSFQTGDASGAVNEPVDDPVSGGTLEDRPMLSWIFRSEEYTALYHQYYDEFLSTWLESGRCADLIDATAAMIAPYVSEDPTKFCTYEEFETGVETLKAFCALRAESVRGQLEGTIPSTSQGQAEDGSALVDCSGLNLSDMGSMGMGGGFGGRGGFDRDGAAPDVPDGAAPDVPDGGEVPAFAPDGDAAGFSGKGGRFSAEFQPEDSMPDPGGAVGGSGLITLAVSAAVLAAGLVFAVLFKRRK